MRTTSITEPVADAPWLEYFPTDSSTAEKTKIDAFPFTIGRNESTDLPIDSSRVSREHAAIYCDESGYRVRDLGSTNGTFLNGKRIDESRLHDGDILVVADVEFSFCCGAGNRSRVTATQIMNPSETSADEEREAVEFVLGVRRLQEQLTHRSLKIRFQSILQLDNEDVFGYEAIAQSDAFNARQIKAERQIRAIECRLCERLQDLQRLVAAEQAAQLPSPAAVFLKLQPEEVGAIRFSESLVRVVAAAGDKQLAVAIPDSAVCDIPSFHDFVVMLRELGLKIAYDGFAGGRVQSVGAEAFAPDFVKLARTVVHGLDRSRDRQRKISDLSRQCADLGCSVIASGVQTQAEAEACVEAGCRFAQGEYYGPPRSIDAFANTKSAVLV